MKRHLIIEVETDESGEFCGEGCLYLIKRVYDSIHVCTRLANNHYDSEAIALDIAASQFKRSDACRAAEVDVDEEIVCIAENLGWLYEDKQKNLIKRLAEAFLKFATAAGITKDE